MELSTSKMKEVWTEWNLRVFVLLSLTLQIVLTLFGKRRKSNHKLLFRMVIWSSYLAADYVASVALGVISSKLSNSICFGENTKLTVFWAPFLLLHLGGPDSITSYSLEDNKLWLRHLLGLVVQATVAFYVFIMAWRNSLLSLLSIPILCVGLIKYGERTWSLRSTGTEDFVEAGLWEIRPWGFGAADDSNLYVRAFEFLGCSTDIFVDEYKINNADTAYGLRSMSFQDAFKVVEIELGLVYDFIHTKVPILCTTMGMVLRLITFSVTCAVLVAFSFLTGGGSNHFGTYSKVDVFITFVLLGSAIALEIWSGLSLLYSDELIASLSFDDIDSNKTSRVITELEPFRRHPRWSNNMSQFSLLRFIMEYKQKLPWPCHPVAKMLKFDPEMLESLLYISDKEVSTGLKKCIFQYFETPGPGHRAIFGTRREDSASHVAECILISHFATEVLYYMDRADIREHCGSDMLNDCKLFKQLSRYMISLVLSHPSVVSFDSERKLRVHHFGLGAIHRIEQHLPEQQYLPLHTDKTQACRILYEHYPREEAPRSIYRDELKYRDELIVTACLIIDKLNAAAADRVSGQSLKHKWKKIRVLWLELLVHTTIKFTGRQHADQLRRGGEFLTHVWLLLSHLNEMKNYANRFQPPTIKGLMRYAEEQNVH